MNRDLIRIHALSNKYYAEEIEEGYIIPSFLYKDDGSTIDLKGNRNNSKLNSNSSYSTNFKNDLIKLQKELNIKLDFIYEFPIIIDKNLWNIILDRLKVDKLNPIRNTNYFLLDILFTKLKICVEIDSSYHDDKLIYDRARDIYLLSKYNITTIRYYEYGKSTIKKNKYYNKFKNIILDSLNKELLRNIYIDYSDIITNNFIIKNTLLLNLIDKIYNYFNDPDILINRTIILTKKDLSIVDNNLFNNTFFINSDNLNLIKSITDLLNDIYGVNLIICDSNKYTFSEINWLIEINQDKNKWNILMNYENIPEWVFNIIDQPPIYIKNYLKIDYSNKQDNYLKDFINLVKKYRNLKTP